jgi:hypothetical protein
MGFPQPHCPLPPVSCPFLTVESPMIQKVGSFGSIGTAAGRVCPRLVRQQKIAMHTESNDVEINRNRLDEITPQRKFALTLIWLL